MKKLFTVCLIVLMGGLFMDTAQMVTPRQSSTDPLPPIILILDGSGSMWGQIDGKTKIGIAREVVGELLDNMDVNRPIGLVVYGHRQKGDCSDIENLMDPGTDNRDEMKTLLKNINPVGKTPLADAALQVIGRLKTSGNSATIILVSDGAESCGGDLCAVVKAAKEAGVDFVLHIVGFDIGESDKLALECAAREGEGVYLDAANGNELSAALEQATELTVEEIDASLSVKVTKDGILYDAAVQIYPVGENKYFASQRTYNHAESNPTIFHIKTGVYDIKVMPIGTNVEEIWRKSIEVSADEVKEIEVDFSAGNISINTTGNGELWDCTVNINKVGESKIVAKGRTYTSANHNPMLKELNPGFYDIRIGAMKLQGQNTTYIFQNIEVKAGETTELSYNFEFGELSILASNNGALWDCTIKVYNGEGKIVAGGRIYYSSSSNPSIELLTPGVYKVEYGALKLFGNDWQYFAKNIEVKVGEKTEVAHDYKTGIARIGSRHDGALFPGKISISQNGVSVYAKRSSADARSNPKEIVLSIGTYEVSVTPIKLDATVKKFTINIVEGEMIEKMVDF